MIWIDETHMKRAIFLRGKRSRDAFAIEYRAKRSLRSCRVHACGAVRPMQREHAAQPYHRFMWWIDQVRFSYVLPSVRVWTSCARDSVVCHIDFGWVEQQNTWLGMCSGLLIASCWACYWTARFTSYLQLMLRTKCIEIPFCYLFGMSN
jgi:hypothetical protein